MGSFERGAWRDASAAVLVAIGAFAASVGHGFVYDDVHVIEQNVNFHSLANWRILLFSPWWGPELYRPFTALTIALDWSIGGGNPHFMHAINVLLHGVTTGLVFLLARAYLPAFGAAAAAFLFAVHPVHVEAVANVVGRAEVLAGLFTVAAALAYRADGILAERGDVSWRRWLATFGALACLWLGLSSKESAFAIPGVFLLIDWFDARQAGTRFATRLARHWVLWTASAALAAEFLWLRTGVLGDLAGVHPAPGLEGEGLLGRALVMTPVAVEHARLLFFPLHLSADYSPNFLQPVAEVTWGSMAGAAVVALAILLALRAKESAPMVSFGLAWIGGTLLVVANVLVPTGVLLAERSMYLPSVGAVLLLGWLATWLAAQHRRVAVAVVAAVVALGMVRTVVRVPVWKSGTPFFHQLVIDAPGSYRGLWVASALAYQADNRRQAEKLALLAMEIQPAFPGLWEYMARRYEEEERWLEAGNALNAAFTLDSTRMRTGADAIVDYVRAGVLDSAESVGRRALRQSPHHFQVRIAMSDLALARGRPLEAMTWRRRVAWTFPHVWQYWFLTLEAALDARYCPEVERSLRKLHELQPDLRELEERTARAQGIGCRSG